MALALDEQLRVANIYAEALFSLAAKAGRIEETRSELEELVKLERQDPAFAAFMSSAAIGAERRAEALERMFRGRLSDEVLNTLLVLNRHGRFGLTAALLRAYELRQKEAAGQVEVAVSSAVELDADEQSRVKRTAEEISGRQPVMTFTVDPELLGGLVMQIGDLRYDNSVRRQLGEARRRLVERGQRGLTVGSQ